MYEYITSCDIVVVRMSDLVVKSSGTIDFLLIIKYTISLFILTCLNAPF